MKNAITLLIVVVLALPFSVYAQNLKDQVPAPKTKLEEFSAKTGAVIVRGFEKIGTVNGLYDTSITVEVKEFINVSTGKKEYGITIQVKKEEGRYDKDNTSYIDYDEIESLISGINYISKIDKTATELSNFQADYKTKGDFGVSTFSSGDKIMVAVSSGHISQVTAFYKMTYLPDIREIIEKAKDKIDVLRK